MTFGSLFAGIGGIDLGLERAGMECRWQVEIDPYCQKVLAKHWPDVKRYGDITQIGDGELEQVDLIAGGFPCQPVSVAGKRLGQDDERWLWPEFARIIRMVRPRFALMENVPGLLGGGMADVLGDLAELGYDAKWSILSAADVGAPHLRKRVFVRAWRSVSPDAGRESLREQSGGVGCDLGDGMESQRKDPTESRYDGKPEPMADPEGEPLGSGFRPSESGGERGDDLATAAARFPTPRAEDSRPKDPSRPQSPGQLNPTWVEWLMGFPIGWTDLEPSETLSSPNAPSGSGEG